MSSNNKSFAEKRTQNKTLLTDDLNMGSNEKLTGHCGASAADWVIKCHVGSPKHSCGLEEPLRAWTALRG